MILLNSRATEDSLINRQLAEHPTAAYCAVAIDAVTKSFRGTIAVDSVNFSVNSGEMVALVGASGSGKSTLLRCLNGLHQADTGSVEIFGIPLQSGGRLHSKVRQLRAQIGSVFQQFNLVNRLSVLDNVLVGNLSQTPPIK